MRAIIATAALVIGTGTSFAALAQTATATHRGGTAATVSASPSGVNANTATTMRHDNRIETTRTAPMPGTPSTDPLRARNAIDADGYAGARITGNSVSAQGGATGSAASALNSTGRSTIDPMAPSMAGAMAGAGGRLPGL
ncbi:hypothetical protein [Novosphingobium sp.]|uniref:hypothetical protein n=1 Tax=Novosphingobium sp. TaxID=1874826 RepID=UPI002FDCD0B0